MILATLENAHCWSKAANGFDKNRHIVCWSAKRRMRSADSPLTFLYDLGAFEFLASRASQELPRAILAYPCGLTKFVTPDISNSSPHCLKRYPLQGPHRHALVYHCHLRSLRVRQLLFHRDSNRRHRRPGSIAQARPGPAGISGAPRGNFGQLPGGGNRRAAAGLEESPKPGIQNEFVPPSAVNGSTRVELENRNGSMYSTQENTLLP